MRISDWSSDVCSSDLARRGPRPVPPRARGRRGGCRRQRRARGARARRIQPLAPGLFRVAQASRDVALLPQVRGAESEHRRPRRRVAGDLAALAVAASGHPVREPGRSEEHTSELQSLMRISYAVFCLHKQIYINTIMSSYKIFLYM